MQAKLGTAAFQSREVPRVQRRQAGTLADCLRRHGGDRDAALVEGYRKLGLTMSAMAQGWGFRCRASAASSRRRRRRGVSKTMCARRPIATFPESKMLR
jgi:hypothetical protein